MFDIPILLIIFNRLETTKQVLSQISKVKPKQLFIAADGPRETKPGESVLCNETREWVLANINWDCEVETMFQEKNLGCKYGVSGAIKWFFTKIEMGIILEDDCFPTISFFDYCRALLLHYKDDNRIGMISGHNYFTETNTKNTDYSIITTCGVWGWASWRRVVDGYNPDIATLNIKAKTICYNKKASEMILLNSGKAACNDINTWDYQFCDYLIVNSLYTIMPNKNQILNLGFADNATHTFVPPEWYNHKLLEFTLPLRLMSKFKPNKNLSKIIERYHLPVKQKIIRKIVKRFKRKIRVTWNLFKIPKEMYIYLMCNLDTENGRKWRYDYYKKKLCFLGKNVVIDTGVTITNPEFVSIGDNTHIDKNVILVASAKNIDISQRILREKENIDFVHDRGKLLIGQNCHISQYSMIYAYYGVDIGNNCVLSANSKVYSLTSMHNNPNHPSQIVSIVPYDGASPTLAGPVVFGDNVWIGLNSVISPGITIGNNSFVRSNSFALESFPENSYIAGDPACLIRKRFPQET